MNKHELMAQAMQNETFQARVKDCKDVADLKALFAEFGADVSEEEVAELCKGVAEQIESGKDGELSDAQLESVAGGVPWALIGIGVACLGSFAVGCYNGWRDAKKG